MGSCESWYSDSLFGPWLSPDWLQRSGSVAKLFLIPPSGWCPGRVAEALGGVFLVPLVIKLVSSPIKGAWLLPEKLGHWSWAPPALAKSIFLFGTVCWSYANFYVRIDLQMTGTILSLSSGGSRFKSLRWLWAKGSSNIITSSWGWLIMILRLPVSGWALTL